MKMLCFVILLCLVLAGCSAQETFETIPDIYATEVSAPACQQVELALSEEAATPTMTSSENDRIYLCDGYTVAVQTLRSGDLNRTLRQSTGFTSDELTVMETASQGVKRYDCVWTAAGEGEDQVCRAAILDDGSYHYVVTVMSAASTAGEFAQQWQQLLDSIRLVSTD